MACKNFSATAAGKMEMKWKSQNEITAQILIQRAAAAVKVNKIKESEMKRECDLKKWT